MECPFCGGGSRVVDSRPTTDGTRRRRVCNECKRRFTTYERLGAPEIKVVKRGDRPAESFDPDKLRRALERVCKRRPVDRDAIARIVRHVEAALLDERRHTIRSWELVPMIIDRLRELDPLSARRFQADYVDEEGNLRPEPRSQEQAAAPPQLDLFEEPADE